MSNELYRIIVDGVVVWVTMQELIAHEARQLELLFANAQMDAVK